MVSAMRVIQIAKACRPADRCASVSDPIVKRAIPYHHTDLAGLVPSDCTRRTISSSAQFCELPFGACARSITSNSIGAEGGRSMINKIRSPSCAAQRSSGLTSPTIDPRRFFHQPSGRNRSRS